MLIVFSFKVEFWKATLVGITQ